MDRLRFSISYLRWPIQKVMTFGFYQPIFKKVTLAGLNSLRQKGCQISVKNWIFDDPFHKQGLVLIIWVLRMITPSELVFFDELRLLRSLRPLWLLRPPSLLRLERFSGLVNHY
jgi:hypothetical protein